MHDSAGDRPSGATMEWLLIVLRGVRRRLGVDRLCGRGLGRRRRAGLRPLRRRACVFLLTGRGAGRLLANCLANTALVRGAEHHYDEVRAFGAETFFAALGQS